MANEKEIEQIKRRLRKEAALDNEKRRRFAQMAKYGQKSSKKIAKVNKQKKRKDVFAKLGRLPGSAFSKQG